MQHKEGCGVCGATLVYSAEDVSVKCNICGKEQKAQIYCPAGHFVCDACHRQQTLDILKATLERSTSKSPSEILEQIMANPEVPMHGPEHHAIVPGVLVAAARNAGYAIPANGIDQAITRGSQVPGGWCGLCGDCGAAVGVGIAMSVLSRATPLTGKQRTLAIEATSQALAAVCDNGPRCCKRAARQVLEIAVPFLNEKLGTKLEKGSHITCQYTKRNRECIAEACPYYA
jgi:7,8-dihydro-6-hydroxymethylpterin dimethyltransferase